MVSEAHCSPYGTILVQQETSGTRGFPGLVIWSHSGSKETLRGFIKQGTSGTRGPLQFLYGTSLVPQGTPRVSACECRMGTLKWSYRTDLVQHGTIANDCYMETLKWSYKIVLV